MSPGAIPEALARAVRLVVLDVDGVLTDGRVLKGGAGGDAEVELKAFHIMDGLGIRMLEWAGVRVVLLSGRPSPATEARAQELGVACVQVPHGYKLEPLESLLREEGLDWAAVAAVADDLADLPVLRRVGLPVAVADAAAEVRAAARWTTSRRGGDAAVREFAEALLRARGEWDRLVDAYVASRERGGDVREHLAAEAGR